MTRMDVDQLRRKARVKAPVSRLLGPELEYYLDKGYAPEVCFESWHLDGLDIPALESLASALRGAGLAPTLHGPFMGLDPGSPNPRDRDLARRYFEATLRAADILRPEVAVFHGGGLTGVSLMEKARWNDTSLPLWSWLAESLAGMGCRLALENVVDGDPEALLPLAQGLAAHNGGWCFDIGHHELFDTVGLKRWLAVLGPHMVQMHLHDNLGERDDHLALGRGAIDLERVFRLVADLPEPAVTLEVDHRDGVEESLEVLAEIWPW